MDDLLDMIATNESPSQISDKIKDVLFKKASERVDAHKSNAINSIFNPPETVETGNDVDSDTNEEE